MPIKLKRLSEDNSTSTQRRINAELCCRSAAEASHERLVKIMNDDATTTFPIKYPEWMKQKYDDVFNGHRYEGATIEAVVIAGGTIHLIATCEPWCGVEKENVIWTENIHHATCPDCLRGHILSSYKTHEAYIMQPIREFLLSMGEDRQFASDSEIKEMMRIIQNHPDEWRRLSDRRK